MERGRVAVEKFCVPYIAMALIATERNCEQKEQKEYSEDQETQERKSKRSGVTVRRGINQQYVAVSIIMIKVSFVPVWSAKEAMQTFRSSNPTTAWKLCAW